MIFLPDVKIAPSEAEVQEFFNDLSFGSILEQSFFDGWPALLAVGIYAFWAFKRKQPAGKTDFVLVSVLLIIAIQSCAFKKFFIYESYHQLWVYFLSDLLFLGCTFFLLGVILISVKLIKNQHIGISGSSVITLFIAFLTIVLDWALLLFLATPFFNRQ